MAYTLIKQLNSEHAHFHFDGLFNNKKVNWDTQLLTLTEYIKQNKLTNTTFKQFTEIESPQSESVKITIVLNVTKINTPTINKTIIMIKQYKNLMLGRHEFGEKHTLK